jgi:hypothetical protein
MNLQGRLAAWLVPLAAMRLGKSRKDINELAAIIWQIYKGENEWTGTFSLEMRRNRRNGRLSHRRHDLKVSFNRSAHRASSTPDRTITR